jgi:hypothetical protein
MQSTTKPANTGAPVRSNAAIRILGRCFDRSICQRPKAQSAIEEGSAISSPSSEPHGPTPTTPSDHSKPKQPTRFFGSVELDPGRPIRSFESIFNAVVSLFQNAKGSKVKLTLEIEAEAPEGFSDTDVRDVGDNSKQLKFRPESTSFE